MRFRQAIVGRTGGVIVPTRRDGLVGYEQCAATTQTAPASESAHPPVPDATEPVPTPPAVDPDPEVSYSCTLLTLRIAQEFLPGVSEKIGTPGVNFCTYLVGTGNRGIFMLYAPPSVYDSERTRITATAGEPDPVPSLGPSGVIYTVEQAGELPTSTTLWTLDGDGNTIEFVESRDDPADVAAQATVRAAEQVAARL